MTNINFYCIEEDINQFLHTFLTNVVVENKKKVIIYSEHQEKIDKLDDTLWTMKKTSFLPHLKIDDKGFEETPLLISNRLENPIHADFLLISNFLDNKEFLNNFDKIFYIFSPMSQQLIDYAKNSWEKYKNMGFELNFIKKDSNNKWQTNKDFFKFKNSQLF